MSHVPFLLYWSQQCTLRGTFVKHEISCQFTWTGSLLYRSRETVSTGGIHAGLCWYDCNKNKLSQKHLNNFILNHLTSFIVHDGHNSWGILYDKCTLAAFMAHEPWLDVQMTPCLNGWIAYIMRNAVSPHRVIVFRCWWDIYTPVNLYSAGLYCMPHET